ncbi:MAG: ATP synthase subunit a [uncultured bacterium]|nr:MAG: ATP synthase subunit a [uncultured bacterium]HBC74685.1 F0F1 ATP synthase subunit A [Candidatus Wallbacteria bacterium]
MRISPDEVIIWHSDYFNLNLTVVTTWFLIIAMAAAARWVTRGVTAGVHVSRRQTCLEIIVLALKDLITGVGLSRPEKYIGFIGTLFLFIAVSNLSTILPYYEPPTGSYSTTTALALCVFIAVPVFGIKELGFIGYLKTYIKPTFLMLPFHIVSQVTRTLALATRLFGNIMSGSMILALLISLAPLIFPIAIIALGLLTGIVQAYIFTILAAVFIAAAMNEE